MELKNIVIVCDYAFFEGGAANVAIQSALAFSKYTDLNIYCFAGNGDPCEQLLNSRVKIIALKMPDLLGNNNKIDAFIKGIYNNKSAEQLKKLLSSLNREETIVHVHTWTKVLSSSIFKVCNELQFKTYLTIHEYFLACPNGACYNYVNHNICELPPLSKECIKCNCDARSYPQKLWRCVRQKKQNKILSEFKDLNYIFISSFQEKQLLKRTNLIKHKFLVKNPINVGERMHIKAEENNVYIYIGRLSGEKGPNLFCEAITKSNVNGVVIGDGILANELKCKYPNIKFTGWLNKTQINKWLDITRVLIFPTLWYEGSPLTVPEVLAHGIPCIVTNCSSATDDISNGVNGEIVEPNVENIIMAINRCKNNDYVKKLSKNAENMFSEDRGSQKSYVENMLKVYME